MKEITKFSLGSSHYRGKEEELLAEPEFKNLKQIYDYLKEHGKCHVRVTKSDYAGSIATFTQDALDKESKELYRRNRYAREDEYIINYYWIGKLSWKGKRNNPKFTLMESNCSVLLDYEGEEVFERFDLKKEKKKLLANSELTDIDGNLLQVGDKVLYMNLRYGSGGCLCHGVVRDFKAHARQQYVSVIIESEDGQESELNYPSSQVYKK